MIHIIADLTKEEKIRSFISHLETITNSKVIGFDFIALGDDDGYFQDYLLHSKPAEEYLEKLKKYFKENPSLLVTNLEYKIHEFGNSSGNDEIATLKFVEKKIPKQQFILNYLEGNDEKYWNKWCEISSEYYGNCKSIVFIKLSFSDLVQTTALFIYFSKTITNKDFLNKSAKVFLFEEAVDVFLPKHINEIKNQSIRAAISQVMARNMSHNIGSHVMNSLTDGEILSKKNKVTCIAYNKECPHALFKDEDTIIYQLAIFNNYVKCRMDYLGDLTFGKPVMHTNKKITDIYKDLDKVRLFLDNISGLADKFQFTIQFTTEFNDKELSIAMPNDLLGCQALYNIIENVIRNTAKHNQGKKENEEAKFTVHFKSISDSEMDIPDKDLWYQVEIYDSVEPSKNIDELVHEQNNKIQEPVLGDDNQLRNSALGLLEMEVSAAYLRKLDIINIENTEYEIHANNPDIIHTKGKLNILKAFAKEVKVGEVNRRCLAYRFFVSKPTEYLFVGDFQDITKERKADLLKMGIWLRSEDDFKSEVENGIVFNHQFIFHKSIQFIKDLENEEKRKYKTQLPLRIMELNEKTDGLIALLKSNEVTFNKIEECVWKIWFDKTKGDYKVVNVITSYQQTERHNRVGRYNIVLQDHNYEDIWTSNKRDIDNGNINFLEPLSNNGQKTLPDFKTTLKQYVYFLDWKDINGYKLFESSIANVLVIDERIQRYAKEDYLNIPNNEIFKYTNIIVPDAIAYPLDADNYTNDLTNKLCQYINGKVPDCKFMLIHFSILERMYKDEMNMIDFNLKKWAAKTRVVVTSGRGKPREHLPSEVCFANLSPVLNVFTQTRSKYGINYLLNQARQ